jgi:hypothetical protein
MRQATAGEGLLARSLSRLALLGPFLDILNRLVEFLLERLTIVGDTV